MLSTFEETQNHELGRFEKQNTAPSEAKSIGFKSTKLKGRQKNKTVGPQPLLSEPQTIRDSDDTGGPLKDQSANQNLKPNEKLVNNPNTGNKTMPTTKSGSNIADVSQMKNTFDISQNAMKSNTVSASSTRDKIFQSIRKKILEYQPHRIHTQNSERNENPNQGRFVIKAGTTANADSQRSFIKTGTPPYNEGACYVD